MPSFGQALKTSVEYEKELNELVERGFPKTITVVSGKLVQFSYETSWKSGTTTPVETGEFVKMQVETADVDENGNPVIVEIETDTPIYDYVEDYTKEELTQEEIETINAWAQQNVEG